MKMQTSKWMGWAIVLLLAAPAPAMEMTTEDRTSLADHVVRTQKLFLDSVAGLSEEQMAYKPDEDKWSISQVMEHLAIGEKFIRDTTTEMLKTAAPAELLEQGCVKEDTVQKFMLDRSQKFQAPAPVAPDGRWELATETLRAFRDERVATLELIAEGADLRAHCAEHPAFGPLDAYGWLMLLSSHTERHVLQIEEIKADSGFPKS